MYQNNWNNGLGPKPSLLDRMERKFGRFAIPNLMLYIASTMAVFFFFSTMQRSFNIISLTSLVPYHILRGQVWRLVTFVFTPPASQGLTMLLAIYFYYIMGKTLEYHWGTFRFNVYYLCGMVGAIIAAFLTGYGTNTYLNLSLFLAVAALFPDQEVLLFYVLPIKVKYLAYLDWAVFAFTIIFGNNISRMAAILSLINFFLFFGPDMVRKIRQSAQYRKNRQNFRQNGNNNNPWR